MGLWFEDKFTWNVPDKMKSKWKYENKEAFDSSW